MYVNHPTNLKTPTPKNIVGWHTLTRTRRLFRSNDIYVYILNYSGGSINAPCKYYALFYYARH